MLITLIFLLQMLSYLVAEAQILILALDIINTRQGTNIDMYQFWQVIYMTSLFMCIIVIPFSFFFYDTDEDQDYVSTNWFFCSHP